MGYNHILHFEGGLESWAEHQQPLESWSHSEKTRRSRYTGEALIRFIDWLSIPQWLLAWAATIVLCGIAYWGLSHWPGHGLQSNGKAIPAGGKGLLTALYFSVVTATSLGYGDITPLGLSRLVAVLEAAGGMLLFGAIIAKVLSHRQEQILEEVHGLTFEERLGRIQTNLHMLISDFHATGELCDGGRIATDRLPTRVESAMLLFERDLRAVRNLFYEPGKDLQEALIELILATLSASLRELVVVLEQLRDKEQQVGLGNLPSIVALVEEICADCVPSSPPPRLRQWLDAIHAFAASIRQHISAK